MEPALSEVEGSGGTRRFFLTFAKRTSRPVVEESLCDLDRTQRTRRHRLSILASSYREPALLAVDTWSCPSAADNCSRTSRRASAFPSSAPPLAKSTDCALHGYKTH